jgi:hypothetical protein
MIDHVLRHFGVVVDISSKLKIQGELDRDNSLLNLFRTTMKFLCLPGAYGNAKVSPPNIQLSMADSAEQNFEVQLGISFPALPEPSKESNLIPPPSTLLQRTGLRQKHNLLLHPRQK